MGANKPLSERIIELRKQATSGDDNERRAAREAIATMIANALNDSERAAIIAELQVPPRGDFTRS